MHSHVETYTHLHTQHAHTHAHNTHTHTHTHTRTRAHTHTRTHTHHIWHTHGVYKYNIIKKKHTLQSSLCVGPFPSLLGHPICRDSDPKQTGHTQLTFIRTYINSTYYNYSSYVLWCKVSVEKVIYTLLMRMTSYKKTKYRISICHVTGNIHLLVCSSPQTPKTKANVGLNYSANSCAVCRFTSAFAGIFKQKHSTDEL